MYGLSSANLLYIFLIQTAIKKLPLSRNFGQAERKRTGQGGAMVTEGHKRSPANNIAWINVVLRKHNTLRFMQAQKGSRRHGANFT